MPRLWCLVDRSQTENLIMIDLEQVDNLRSFLMERFTAADLCEILNLNPEDVIDRFIDEVIGTDWGDYL